jgi:hypothetical protein
MEWEIVLTGDRIHAREVLDGEVDQLRRTVPPIEYVPGADDRERPGYLSELV